MPAAVAVPLITGAVTAGTSLVGAKMASNAAKDASKSQVQAADRASQAAERIFAMQRQNTHPYVKGGQDAFARLMGQQFGTPTSMPQPSGYGLIRQGAASNSPFGQAMYGQGMVSLRAPD